MNWNAIYSRITLATVQYCIINGPPGKLNANIVAKQNAMCDAIAQLVNDEFNRKLDSAPVSEFAWSNLISQEEFERLKRQLNA